MPLLVYAAIALFLAAAGVGVVHTYNSSIKEAAAQKQAAEGWKAASDYWQVEQEKTEKDRKDADNIAKASKGRLAAANQELADRDRTIAGLRLRSPAAAGWYDTPVPDDVRRLRRNQAGCTTEDPAVPCPGVNAGPDAGAAVAGRDKPSPGWRSEAAPPSSAAVQR